MSLRLLDSKAIGVPRMAIFNNIGKIFGSLLSQFGLDQDSRAIRKTAEMSI